MSLRIKDLRDFDSLLELLDYFTTEKVCEDYLEILRWNGVPVCPYCESERVNRLNGKTRRFKCYGCRKQFGVKVGTIFHDSPISLRKWFVAMYLVTAHKSGISSHQLARDLKIRQATAWFVLQRIRETYNSKPEVFTKPTEIDETYIGGKEKNKHADKKLKGGQGGANLSPVLGIIERDGKVYAIPVKNRQRETIMPIITSQVEPGATIYTDEFSGYKALRNDFNHDFVCHKAKEYVSGTVHTNNIENFWSILKRGINGIYIHVSDKHLGRYVNESAFRYNNRKLSEGSKFDVALANATNKRLSYKRLTNG